MEGKTSQEPNDGENKPMDLENHPPGEKTNPTSVEIIDSAGILVDLAEKELERLKPAWKPALQKLAKEELIVNIGDLLDQTSENWSDTKKKLPSAVANGLDLIRQSRGAQGGVFGGGNQGSFSGGGMGGPGRDLGGAGTLFIQDNMNRNRPHKSDEMLLRYDIGFGARIPIYIHSDKPADALAQLLSPNSAEVETDLWLITDQPGMGKTATVLEAVERSRSCCAYIVATSPIFAAGATAMSAICRQIPSKTLTSDQLIQKLRPVTDAMLTRILQLTQKQTKKFIQKPGSWENRIMITENSLRIEDTDDMWPELLGDLYKSIDQVNPNASLVLFFDDIQKWSVPLTFQKEVAPKKVDRDDYESYYLLALSESLHKLKTSSISRIRVVMAGTSAMTDRFIRVGSQMKSRQFPIHPPSDSDIRRILQYFVNWPSDELLDYSISQLSGNPRAVQYFLNFLSLAHSHLYPKDITKQMLDVIIQKAYEEWTARTITMREESEGEVKSGSFAVQFMMLLANPTLFNAEPHPDSIQITEVDCPKLLRRFAEGGGLRFRVHKVSDSGGGTSSDRLTFYRPTGFVSRYLSEMYQTADPSARRRFVAEKAYAFRVRVGGPGHALEAGVAAELTCAASPLYKTIFHQIRRPTAMVDPAMIFRPVTVCAKIQDVPLEKMNSVHLVQDDPDLIGQRLVDLGFRLCLTAPPRDDASIDYAQHYQRVFMELKTEKKTTALWLKCLKFFRADLGDSTPRVFLSLQKFLGEIPKKPKKPPVDKKTGKLKETALEASTEVIKLMQQNPGRFVVLEGMNTFSGCKVLGKEDDPVGVIEKAKAKPKANKIVHVPMPVQSRRSYSSIQVPFQTASRFAKQPQSSGSGIWGSLFSFPRPVQIPRVGRF